MTQQLSNQNMLWEETIPGGAHWSFQMKRGSALRITDVAGGANLSALFYNMEEKLERYNMADTLKAQHTAHLTKGFVCYSDMGRVLASITGDSCGWHDTLCGMSNAALVEKKYGKASYQQSRNEMHRNARDSFIIELGKWGMGKRDIVPKAICVTKKIIQRREILSSCAST
jgi:urea carboxylase-associated protein 2